MKAAVVVFPGSNCDRDVATALRDVSGAAVTMVWHGDTALPPTDLIVLPGGFSFGDYLRSGAMAARSPIMRAAIAKAHAGVPVLGICNGFQILTEAGLLPGALMRNRGMDFVCRDTSVRPLPGASPFLAGYACDAPVRLPVAHKDGCYFADAETLARLDGEGRIALRYAANDNPNGSAGDIAGITDATGRVLGVMPHPERAADALLGAGGGLPFFAGLADRLAA